MKKKDKIEYISTKILKEGKINVTDLAKEMNITEKTVRIYLTQLEESGVLIRTFGGAIINNSFNEMFPITDSYRTRANNLKRRIAFEALKMIHENDTIFLDDGSTCYELARLLGNTKITVVTNDLLIVQELKNKEKIDLYLVGGNVPAEPVTYCTSGNHARNFVKQFNFDIYFIGVATIDTDAGLMIYHHGDAKFKRACMAAAKKNVCLADSEKFNKTSFIKICDYEDVDYVISDTNLDEDLKKKYKRTKPKLIFG